jgi:hypothetical protein
MIGLGLRLAVAGGREAVVRLATIAAAVAVGTLLLLSVLAGLNGFSSQNQRYSWLNSRPERAAAASDTASGRGLWWRVGYDLYQGRDIVRVDVAATGPNSPVPPGIPRVPGAGEYYASPDLTALLHTVPAGQLADRYPGHLVGTVGPAALQSPNSLTLIVGHRPEELSREPNAALITRIWGTSPAECDDCMVGARAAGIDLVVSAVALGMLFPLLIFIGTVTRLAAARREERFAAMRLVGATPRQVAVLATAEAGAAASVGVLLGFALFYALRSQIAAIPFTGNPFFTSDIRLTVGQALAVALGVPVGAALAARIALRRVRISPLGVTRRVTPRPPRAYRLIPLIAGLAELYYFVGRRPSTSNGQMLAYLPGFFLTMGGLVIAGPWLTMVGSRLLATRARRPAALIAARRLADNPRAGFRAVSGLVLALFVASVATGVITTIDANRGPAVASADRQGTLVDDFDTGEHTGIPAAAMGSTPHDLTTNPGVRGVFVVHVNPAFDPQVGPEPQLSERLLPGLVSCADLARVPTYGRCEAGAEVAAVNSDLGIAARRRGPAGVQVPAWPTSTVRSADLAGLPVLSIVVRTDGSAAVVERTRTQLELAYPQRFPPSMGDEFNDTFVSTLAGWQQLADVVIVASLAIAGASLAVAVAGGLNERKRAFSLLRLTGVPLRVLHRVVALESGVPLLVAAVVATAAGFLAADLFLRAQMEYTLLSPAPGYYVTVGIGLLACTGVIASTLPLLRRITGPETARNG